MFQVSQMYEVENNVTSKIVKNGFFKKLYSLHKSKMLRSTITYVHTITICLSKDKRTFRNLCLMCLFIFDMKEF